MSEGWTPTTDDDFPIPEMASRVFDAMQEWSAGESQMTGYEDEEGTIRQWTVLVAHGPSDTVGVHVNWETGEIRTAWREEESRLPQGGRDGE